MEALESPSRLIEEWCWPSVRKLAPCEASCPAKVNVPGYVIAISQGNFQKALDTIRESISLPAICGYVCHHPCEDACIRAEIDESVAIRSLKRFVADYELEGSLEKVAPAERTKGGKVAVVGSGPAGLTAAYDLVKQGYGVTVYEALPVAGGMLVIGIPEFVLPRRVIEAEIERIKDLGVEIKTNVRLGKDLSLDDIMRQGFKAVFLAIGMQESLKLRIPGLDLEGVFYALPFLREVNLSKGVKLEGKVIVIGGGNVAVDTARAAIRSGAAEVHLVCIESRQEMPAFKWEIESAEEEGVEIHCALMPQEIASENGRIAGINFADVKSIEVDDVGRLRPIPVEGSKHFMDADAAIIAIGQGLDSSFLKGAKEVALSRKGTIEVAPTTLATSMPGVFAGGDAVSGIGTVIEAIAAGHRVAQSIDRYLKGEGLKEIHPVRAMAVMEEVEEERIPKFVERRDRQRMPRLSVAGRKSSFKEVELGFPRDAAINEAKRCLNCPVCGNCIFYRSQMCYDTAARLF